MVSSGFRRLVKHVAPGGPAYRRALLSDVVSAAALGAVGDVICQIGAEGVSWKDLDKRRVIALTVFSSAYIGELAAIPRSAFKWFTTLTVASRCSRQGYFAITCTKFILFASRRWEGSGGPHRLHRTFVTTHGVCGWWSRPQRAALVAQSWTTCTVAPYIPLRISSALDCFREIR